MGCFVLVFSDTLKIPIVIHVVDSTVLNISPYLKNRGLGFIYNT